MTAGRKKVGVETVSCIRVAALAPLDLPSSIARMDPFCGTPNRGMTRGYTCSGGRPGKRRTMASCIAAAG